MTREKNMLIEIYVEQSNDIEYLMNAHTGHTYINLYKQSNGVYMIAHHVWIPKSLSPITAWIESDDIEWLIKRYRQLLENVMQS